MSQMSSTTFDWSQAGNEARALTDEALVDQMKLHANRLAACWRVALERRERMIVEVALMPDRGAVVVEAFLGRRLP